MCITAEAEWARAALNLHHALSALTDPAPPRDPAASRMQNPISSPQPSSQPAEIMPNASVGLPPTAEPAQSQIQQGGVDQPGSSAQHGTAQQGSAQHGTAQQDTADPPGSSAQHAQQAQMHSTPNIPAVPVDGTGATSPGAAHAPSTIGAAANSAPETDINSGSGHIAPSVGNTRVGGKNNNGQVALEAVWGQAASEAFHFAYDLLGNLRHTCPLLGYNLLCDGPPFEQHICHRWILLHEMSPCKSLL